MPALPDISKRVLLAVCLLLLHGVLSSGADSAPGRSLWLVHFGFFLLWQPFVGYRRVLAWPYLLLGGVLLAALLWLGSWALILWMLLLAGVVGGCLFFQAPFRLRLFYLAALADLLGGLLLLAVPQALGGSVAAVALVPLAQYALPGLMLLALFWSFPVAEYGERGAVDLLYSLFVLLVLALLVAGAIAAMHVQAVSYFQALLTMLLVMAALLLALALVWSPRFGFAGLAGLVSRYMFADSLPFEQLLRDLGEMARQEADPRQFMQQVSARLPRYLRGACGLQWKMGEGLTGIWGRQEGAAYTFQSGEMQMVMHMEQAMSPTLLWHARLFAQVVAEYCRALDQAQRLQEMSYIEAVHQAGARLTHDVKNLLQSLNALCAACAEVDEARLGDLRSLMQKQLPAITQRLQATLGKLSHPRSEGRDTGAVQEWWSALCARFAGSGVSFERQGDGGGTIAAALFDSAAENLLQNAFDKRAVEPGITITLTLCGHPDGWYMQVSDTGGAVPAAIAERLGHVFPATENGLGIGLYQLVKQAEGCGYKLRLAANRPGCVCFELAPQQP